MAPRVVARRTPSTATSERTTYCTEGDQQDGFLQPRAVVAAAVLGSEENQGKRDAVWDQKPRALLSSSGGQVEAAPSTGGDSCATPSSQ